MSRFGNVSGSSKKYTSGGSQDWIKRAPPTSNALMATARRGINFEALVVAVGSKEKYTDTPRMATSVRAGGWAYIVAIPDFSTAMIVNDDPNVTWPTPNQIEFNNLVFEGMKVERVVDDECAQKAAELAPTKRVLVQGRPVKFSVKPGTNIPVGSRIWVTGACFNANVYKKKDKRDSKVKIVSAVFFNVTSAAMQPDGAPEIPVTNQNYFSFLYSVFVRNTYPTIYHYAMQDEHDTEFMPMIVPLTPSGPEDVNTELGSYAGVSEVIWGADKDKNDFETGGFTFNKEDTRNGSHKNIAVRQAVGVCQMPEYIEEGQFAFAVLTNLYTATLASFGPMSLLHQKKFMEAFADVLTIVSIVDRDPAKSLGFLPNQGDLKQTGTFGAMGIVNIVTHNLVQVIGQLGFKVPKVMINSIKNTKVKTLSWNAGLNEEMVSAAMESRTKDPFIRADDTFTYCNEMPVPSEEHDYYVVPHPTAYDVMAKYMHDNSPKDDAGQPMVIAEEIEADQQTKYTLRVTKWTENDAVFKVFHNMLFNTKLVKDTLFLFAVRQQEEPTAYYESAPYTLKEYQEKCEAIARARTKFPSTLNKTNKIEDYFKATDPNAAMETDGAAETSDGTGQPGAKRQKTVSSLE